MTDSAKVGLSGIRKIVDGLSIGPTPDPSLSPNSANPRKLGLQNSPLNFGQTVADTAKLCIESYWEVVVANVQNIQCMDSHYFC